MEAMRSFEMSVDFHWTTRRCVPEDRTLHNQRYKNLRTYTELLYFSDQNNTTYVAVIIMQHYFVSGTGLGENGGIQLNPKMIKSLATSHVIQITCGQNHSLALSQSECHEFRLKINLTSTYHICIYNAYIQSNWVKCCHFQAFFKDF
jgi:hypothetical protein